jgi:hypothetical protein
VSSGSKPGVSDGPSRRNRDVAGPKRTKGPDVLYQIAALKSLEQLFGGLLMSITYAQINNAVWQRVLRFCSHKTPNQRQRGRSTPYQQKTPKYAVHNNSSTRSEGYRSRPSRTHNPSKDGGSNPPRNHASTGLGSTPTPFCFARVFARGGLAC